MIKKIKPLSIGTQGGGQQIGPPVVVPAVVPPVIGGGTDANELNALKKTRIKKTRDFTKFIF
ncbi:MAG: hypothetical protein IT236_14040, partial [Bacteroidia bacterium]|nr:hypothetical protein [Bacteroidia bacterium]